MAVTDARAAARRWRDTWREAWAAHDADAVADLYAADALFRSEPFREDHHGHEGARAYATWAFETESAPPEVWFGEPIVQGDRAACEYWAIVAEGGEQSSIAGISFLSFDDDGLVLSQRDCWNQQPGRHLPPAGWGE
ncbi:MAG: nuclear transport factor 2 family protein [Chloroflexota bacterium]